MLLGGLAPLVYKGGSREAEPPPPTPPKDSGGTKRRAAVAKRNGRRSVADALRDIAAALAARAGAGVNYSRQEVCGCPHNPTGLVVTIAMFPISTQPS